MTGASKILTVSYGTFSCTLEGFDDPFGTMKAIAEYFRDLAAGDRYFGAEPPVPDAAMLHRIAEREIQRRVEAKIQENGVVLRAADEGDAVAELPAATQAPAPVAVPAVLDAPVPAAESVADRLSRLRSEVAQQAVATAPVVSFALPEEDEGYDLPDVVAMPDDVAAALAQDADEPAGAAEPAEPVTPAPDVALADIDTPFPEELLDETTEDLPEAAAIEDAEVIDAPMPATPADTDSLLAGLMANLAASATPVAPAKTQDAVAALQDAMPAVGEPALEAALQPDAGLGADQADDFVQDIADDLTEAQDDAVQVAPSHGETGQDFDLSSLARQLDPTPTQAAAEQPTEDAPDLSVADEGADVLAQVQEPEVEAPAAAQPESLFVPIREEDDADVVAQAQAPEVEAPAAAQPESLFAPIRDEDEAHAYDLPAEDAPALRPDAAEKLQRARARVVRIRRVEAAPAPAPAETVAPAPLSAPAVEEPAPVRALTAEDEADLEAELAALRGEADPAAIAPEPEVVPPAPTAADSRRVFEGEAAEAALSRLMAQADEHLEGAESKRRLSAIAHLKAAVAATVAERKATGQADGKGEQPSRLARYRDDLAMVVRNKLGVPPTAPAQGDRPAPLVLVSEQRIDRPRPVAVPNPAPATPSSPVRPRRIAGATGLALAEDDADEDDLFDAEAPASDSRGFAEFADRLGAQTLSEQLEAAAAYMACVEGRDHFTRPQLMRLAQDAFPDWDIAREDGLRSFGTLLRTGRLVKVRRGQFALSEASAYLAEGRRIAG